MPGRTEANEHTREEERGEGLAAHQADRPPTPPEEAAAEQEATASSATTQERVAEHYREMTELGANEKGEGRIP